MEPVLFERCLISLKPLSGRETTPGYTNAAKQRLFGNGRLSVPLRFDRKQFAQESRRNVAGMSISGVQQKLSITRLHGSGELEPTATGGEFILKPSPEAFPHAAENEHAAMLISSALGIPTAQCGLVPFKGGNELAYITRRFDRAEGGEKIPQEDLLQCAGRRSHEKYDLTYEQAGQIIRASTGKLPPVLDMIQRVILAYIIGNNDLHMKNLSLQRLEENKSGLLDRLTPNYDVLFCQAFDDPPGHTFFACGLLLDTTDGEEEFTPEFERLGFYSRGDFLELARRLEVPDKPVERFMDKARQKQKLILDIIDNSYMPTSMKARAADTVTNRLSALRPR